MSWQQRAPGVHHRPGRSGRVVGIVGGVHGDEPAGAAVVERVRAWPEAAWAGCPHGVVVAVGHPGALAVGARTLPGEPDLNRAFGADPVGGPVGARAAVLREALADVHVLLDLHQTRQPIEPLAVLPDAPGARALAGRLGLGLAVQGAGLAYGDAMLADWVVRRGGLALTVELGRIGDPACLDRGEDVVQALLFDEDRGAEPAVWRIDAVLAAPGAGLRFARPLHNGSPVQAGEVLGTAEGRVLQAPGDGVVFLPRAGVPRGAPAALFAVRAS